MPFQKNPIKYCTQLDTWMIQSAEFNKKDVQSIGVTLILVRKLVPLAGREVPGSDEGPLMS